MKIQIKRCTKQDFEIVCKYLDKLPELAIKITPLELVVYFNQGRVYAIHNQESNVIEGLCLAMVSKKTNGVFIPVYFIDSVHRDKLSSYTLMMEVAKYIGSRKIAIQMNQSVNTKYLIDCGNGIYTLSKRILKNPIGKFLNDTFLNPIDLNVKEEILTFQKEYYKVFPHEIQPSTTLIQTLKSKCDICLESKYNLVYLKLVDNKYKILGQWALANSTMEPSENMKAIRECTKFLKELDKEIIVAPGSKKEYINLASKINSKFKD